MDGHCYEKNRRSGAPVIAQDAGEDAAQMLDKDATGHPLVETGGRPVKPRRAKRWLLGLGLLLVPLLVLAVRGGQWRACVLTDDAARGRALAHKTCTADCHSISPATLDLKNPGPNLQNVYMSLAGTTPAPLDPTDVYHHPLPPLEAARDAGIVWTDENLLEYLRDPKAFLDRKTGHNFKNSLFYMPFNIREESERRSAVAYLKAIKGHPECD
jgi:cytochrome c